MRDDEQAASTDDDYEDVASEAFMTEGVTFERGWGVIEGAKVTWKGRSLIAAKSRQTALEVEAH